MSAKSISAAEIVQTFDAIFLDAYGVLVDEQGALPHAREFIDALNKERKLYCVLSNSSYCSAHESLVSYRQKGLAIQEHCVITAATVLSEYLHAHPEHRRVKLLGGERSKGYLRACGAEIVEGMDYSAVVVGDQEGLVFPDDINRLVSEITHKVLASERVVILLANPDIVYPIQKDHFGITSGSLCKLLEEALSITLMHRTPEVISFGKPYFPIFAKVHEFVKRHSSVSSPSIVMIGDQVATDIRGGNEHNMTTVLMQTGVFQMFGDLATSQVILQPDYLCSSLALPL